MFFSANSGPQIGMEHLIHNVRFYDTQHLHDGEGQDSSDDLREFHGKKAELDRENLVKTDEKFNIDSYNHQLIRHNKLYSKVVSEFITNAEMIVNYLHELPDHEIVAKIRKDTSAITSRFASVNQ